MLFSRFSRVENQEDNSFQSRGVSLNSAKTSAYGEHDGRDTEEVPLGDFHIPVKKGFGCTVF